MSFLYRAEYQIRELNQIASEVLQVIADQSIKIVGFKGDLGAGKTTLIQAMCSHLGVMQTVNSPTFSLLHEYSYPKGKVYHFDLYRLNNIDECLAMGLPEYLDSGQYCWIEWYELIEPILPNDFIRIKIDHSGPEKRIVSLTN